MNAFAEQVMKDVWGSAKQEDGSMHLSRQGVSLVESIQAKLEQRAEKAEAKVKELKDRVHELSLDWQVKEASTTTKEIQFKGEEMKGITVKCACHRQIPREKHRQHLETCAPYWMEEVAGLESGLEACHANYKKERMDRKMFEARAKELESCLRAIMTDENVDAWCDGCGCCSDTIFMDTEPYKDALMLLGLK